MTIHVDIVSAEAEIYSGQAEMVFAPALMGEVGIAPGHTPLLTRLKPGEVRLKLADGSEEAFYVSGGILEVQPRMVTVLSDTAVRAHDIDEAAALEASSAPSKCSLIRAPRSTTPRPWPSTPRPPRSSRRSNACGNAPGGASPPFPNKWGMHIPKPYHMHRSPHENHPQHR